MGTENRAEGPEKAAMRGQARTWSRRRRSKLCFIRRRCTWEQSGQCVPEPEAVSPDGENHEVPRTLGKTCPWHLTENRSFWSGKKKKTQNKKPLQVNTCEVVWRYKLEEIPPWVSQCLYWMLVKHQAWGWTDSSAVRSVYCSCRGPKLDS